MRHFSAAQNIASSVTAPRIVFLEGEFICSDKHKVLQRLQRSGYSCLHAPFLPWLSQTYHKNYLLDHSEKDSKMIVNDFNQYIQDSITKQLNKIPLKNNLIFLDTSPLTPMLYFYNKFASQHNIHQWYSENVTHSVQLKNTTLKLFLCEADEVEAAYRLANHKYETLFALQQEQQLKPQNNTILIANEEDYDKWYRVVNGKQFVSLDSSQVTQMMLHSAKQDKSEIAPIIHQPNNETKIEIEMVRTVHNLYENLMQQVLQIPKERLKPVDMSLIQTVDDLLVFKNFLFTTDTRQSVFVLNKHLEIASPTFKVSSIDQ